MTKTHAAVEASVPAAWERLVAVVTWLSVNIPILAVIAGGLEFLLLRKRRRFVAVHGLRAALSAVIIMCVIAGFYFGARLLGNFRDVFDYLLNGVLQGILRSPDQISYYWSMLTPVSRLLLAVLLGIFPAILLLSIIGALTAVFGQRRAGACADRDTTAQVATTAH